MNYSYHCSGLALLPGTRILVYVCKWLIRTNGNAILFLLVENTIIRPIWYNLAPFHEVYWPYVVHVKGTMLWQGAIIYNRLSCHRGSIRRPKAKAGAYEESDRAVNLLRILSGTFMHVPIGFRANSKKIYRNSGATYPIRSRYCPSPKYCLCCVFVPKTLCRWVQNVAGATTTLANPNAVYLKISMSFFLASFFVS